MSSGHNRDSGGISEENQSPLIRGGRFITPSENGVQQQLGSQIPWQETGKDGTPLM